MSTFAQFVNQFCADLRTELLSPVLPACSICIIHNAGAEEPDSCRLNCCQYYFDRELTTDTKRRDAWIRDVLREAYRAGGAQGYLRWARRLGWETNGLVALDTLYDRHIYSQNSISDFRRLIELIREIDVEILQFDRQLFRITPEECAILDQV